LDEELEKIKGNYDLIIAKSAGIILALRGISESKVIVKKCVFIGTPITWAEKNGFQLLKDLNDYKTPTLFIQNKNDPTCSSHELKDILESKNVKNYKVVEYQEDSHDYDCINRIIKAITKFSIIPA